MFNIVEKCIGISDSTFENLDLRCHLPLLLIENLIVINYNVKWKVVS